MSFGGTEIIIVLAVIILFFGARKIPELARGIGQGISEFRKVSEDHQKEGEGEQTEDAQNVK